MLKLPKNCNELARAWTLCVPLAVVAVSAAGCKLPLVGGGGTSDVPQTLLAAQDPNGVYGISPETIKVSQGATAQYPSYNVFSSDTAGQSRLKTDLNSGWLNGATANSIYTVLVYGVDSQGANSPKPLAQYHIRTWPGFDRAPLSLVKADGARYDLNWNYTPWMSLPAGTGILDATQVRCAVKANALPADDPFSGGKIIEGPITAGTLRVDAFQLGLTGGVVVQCEAIYADKTVYRNGTHLAFTPAFNLLPCTVTQGIQDKPFSCVMGLKDDAGKTVTDLGGIQFEPDSSQNTCGFLSTKDGINLTGTPNDNQVGDCTLAYRLKGSTGALVNAQAVHIANVQPIFTKLSNPGYAIEDDVKSTDGGATVIFENGSIATDEDLAGRKVGINFGTYSETRTGVAVPCSQYGMVSVDRLTGRTLFKPDPDYYGLCYIGVQYDDGNPAENNNLAVKVFPVRVLARNDAPVISDGPGTSVNGVRTENCGDHCYVGAEYDFTLGTNQGGGKYVEIDQTLKVTKCASSAPTVLQITYCDFDAKTKQLELSFAPLSAPATGVAAPTITVQVTDDGYDEMPASYDASGLLAVTRKANPLTSAEFTFAVDIRAFQQNMRPAVAVSRPGCLSCHANVDGDILTDLGLAHTQSDFWQNTATTGQNVLGDLTGTAYGFGLNTIENLTGNFYLPRMQAPQLGNGSVSSPNWTYNVGAVNGFSAPATVAELLGTPGRVQKLTGDWMPTGSPVPASGINTLVNPAIANAGKVLDTFVLNGQTRVIKSIVIDYPLSADIQAIDHRGRLDWTAPTAQYAYLGASNVVNGVTLFDGLKVNGTAANAAAMYVSNDPAKNGVVTCVGDVLVKGTLVLYGATIKTSTTTPCRLYVDGAVFIGQLDANQAANGGNGYGVTVLGADGTPAGAGNVQITSTVGIAMGMGPTLLASWSGPLHDAAVATGTVTDAVFDGCSGAAPSSCPGAADANGAHTGGRAFNFDHLMLNAPIVTSRYLGQFKGAVIADFAAFRLSTLKYVYQTSLANDVPFPRLRSLRTKTRPAGLVVFDVVPQ